MTGATLTMYRPKRRWHKQLIAAPATLVLMLGCGFEAVQAFATDPGAQQILISSFMFMPVELTIKAGSTVTWTNLDEEAHSVVSDAGLFRSGALDTNEHFTFQFDRPGTYHFTCSLHPRMVGTVIVD